LQAIGLRGFRLFLQSSVNTAAWRADIDAYLNECVVFLAMAARESPQSAGRFVRITLTKVFASGYS
jgi:hypothetical protein